MAADVADLERTFRLVTDDTVAFLETVVGQPADLVGHGDGALVAMLSEGS